MSRARCPTLRAFIAKSMCAARRSRIVATPKRHPQELRCARDEGLPARLDSQATRAAPRWHGVANGDTDRTHVPLSSSLHTCSSNRAGADDPVTWRERVVGGSDRQRERVSLPGKHDLDSGDPRGLAGILRDWPPAADSGRRVRGQDHCTRRIARPGVPVGHRPGGLCTRLRCWRSKVFGVRAHKRPGSE
jgi:hypothetical protein